ncbi:MAG: hypothetical protein DRQ51_09585 [Gammaproteobacteria bacterium]|nr:MAG: hypothetical protein DRQ51_09585 [Gammaproteobacteria bacterium]
MTTTIGIREFSRNSNLIQNYDYIQIEDKKTHQRKGLFVSDKYADMVKKLLKKKIAADKQHELDEIMQFAGSMKIKDRFKDLDGKELKIEIAKARCGM